MNRKQILARVREIKDLINASKEPEEVAALLREVIALTEPLPATEEEPQH